MAPEAPGKHPSTWLAWPVGRQVLFAARRNSSHRSGPECVEAKCLAGQGEPSIRYGKLLAGKRARLKTLRSAHNTGFCDWRDPAAPAEVLFLGDNRRPEPGGSAFWPKRQQPGAQPARRQRGYATHSAGYEIL